MISRKDLKDTFKILSNKIKKTGGKIKPLVYKSPATEKDIIAVEEKLGFKIPSNFKDILLTITAHCEFSWSLPKEFSLPKELKYSVRGRIHWNLYSLEKLEEDKKEWLKEVFSNPDNEYDKVWYNKMVFQEVPNGDYLAIDLSNEQYGKIVYLSHDEGQGHGYILANSFGELLQNWPLIGCVGDEDWVWLPYVDSSTSGLNPTCDFAVLLKKTLGL